MNRLRLNIGPRLVLCFALIIISMLTADVVVLWQFHVVRVQVDTLENRAEALAKTARGQATEKRSPVPRS